MVGSKLLGFVLFFSGFFLFYVFNLFISASACSFAVLWCVLFCDTVVSIYSAFIVCYCFMVCVAVCLIWRLRKNKTS